MWRHLRRFPASRVVQAVGQAVRAAVFSSQSSSRTGVAPSFRPAARDIVALFGERGPRARVNPRESRYEIAFPFGATVTLETSQGAFSHAIRIPAGAAGNAIEEIEAVAKAKFVREGSPFIDQEQLEAWADLVLGGEADHMVVNAWASRKSLQAALGKVRGSS